MKELQVITKTYDMGDGYRIDIVELAEEYEAWIYEVSNEVKMLMFGCPKSQQTYEEFLSMVEANFPSYQEDYCKQFVDCYDEMLKLPNYWVHCPETKRFKEHWCCSNCDGDVTENPRYYNNILEKALDFTTCPYCGEKMSIAEDNRVQILEYVPEELELKFE